MNRLSDLFEAQAQATPSAVAVTDDRSGYTYAELDQASNRLARLLREKGAGRGRLVALAMPRCVELIVAILAILKTGAAYVPLDLEWPENRFEHILQDSGADLFVTGSEVGRSRAGGRKTIDLTEAAGDLQRHDGAPLTQPERPSGNGGADPAYLIYTSGTTGGPKGAVISHHAVARLFTCTKTLFDLGPEDVWTCFHSFAFDFSVWEIWGALLHGGRLIVVDDDIRRSPIEFAQLLRTEGVTVLSQTPSAFYALTDRGVAQMDDLALRLVIFGGEALNTARLLAWKPALSRGLRLVNMYGITETTVHVTAHDLTVADIDAGPPAPIGEPLADLDLYLLDDFLQPVPDGVVGEIFVSGPGLANGYHERPELTAERFPPCPFRPGERMYRSGDLGLRRLDGSLVCLGRADRQIKIRGYRVEPAEIEAALTRFDTVGQAAVLVRPVAGEPALVAWVTPAQPGADIDLADLRARLAERLPSYMRPARLMAIERLPRTANDKLDADALPEPDPQLFGSAPELEGETPRVRVLQEIFARVLSVNHVPPDASFFDLGGHSLAGVRVMVLIEDKLGLRVPVRMLYENASPRSLAEALDQASLGDATMSALPLHLHAGGDTIFMVHWIEPDLAAHLGKHVSVWGLAFGLGGDAAAARLPLPPSVEALAAHYIEEMRCVQPVGPYHLLGHSAGGVVAYEMARRLRSAGETVGLVALLDTTFDHGAPTRVGLAELTRNATRAFLANPVNFVSVQARRRVGRSRLGRADKRVTSRLIQMEMTCRNYRPEPIPGDVWALKAEQQPVWLSREPPPPVEVTLRPLVQGRFHLITVPGDHMGIVKNPGAAATAAVIESAMAGEVPASVVLEAA